MALSLALAPALDMVVVVAVDSTQVVADSRFVVVVDSRFVAVVDSTFVVVAELADMGPARLDMAAAVAVRTVLAEQVAVQLSRTSHSLHKQQSYRLVVRSLVMIFLVR
jgi:hypothetical protein